MIKDDILLANFDCNSAKTEAIRLKKIKFWKARLETKDKRVKMDLLGKFYIDKTD